MRTLDDLKASKTRVMRARELKNFARGLEGVDALRARPTDSHEELPAS